MKKRIISVLLALVMVCALLPAIAWAASTPFENNGGNGTEDSPYEINDLEQLEAFQKYINDGNGRGEYFKLTADIDMSVNYRTVSWSPIGTISASFKGTFDGDGHTISKLNINTTTGSKQGLFGYVDSSGTIKNLTVSGSVTGGSYTGGIVGENHGVISDCINNCDVKGNNDYVGGIAGYNYLSIKNCYNTGTVSNSKGIYDNYIGGIVGYNNSTGSIENCHNKGTITGAGDYTGGIAGSNVGSARIENCYNEGAITGTGNFIGGIAGNNDSSNFENCYNTGEVSGTGDNIGGIAGQNTGKVDNCYYLDSSCNATGGGISKTEAEFSSGEVAWLLQDGQSVQMWGQKLTDDSYPILTSDTAKKVCKVTFATSSQSEYAAKYANESGTVELPAEPTLDGTVFDHWSTEKSASGGEKFDRTTKVTGDVTVYAVGREPFGGDSSEIVLSETYGYADALTVDLDKHMKYANTRISSEGKFTYEISDTDDTGASISENTLNVPVGLNAGDYTITVKATEKTPQYSLMSVESYDTVDVTLTMKVSIAKAAATVTAPTAKELTYTGAAQELVTAGSVESVSVSDCGTMQYSLDGDTYSADIPTGKDAGTYTVYWQVDGADETNYNYSSGTSGQVTVTIAKATPAVEVSASRELTYGSEITLTATVTATGVTDNNNITGKVTFKAGTEELGTADATNGTATLTIQDTDGTNQKALFDNSTQVTAEYKGNDNISGSTSAPKEVTVSPKTLSYTVSANDKTYDGKTSIDVTLAADGVLYSDNVTLSATGTLSGSDVGEYKQVNLSGITVGGTEAKYYKVDETSKENVALQAAININKANISDVTAPTPIDRTYDGTTQALVTAPEDRDDGKMQYALGDATHATDDYSDTIPQAKDAGTYYVWYKVVGDGNHNDSTENKVTVTIEKKEVTLTWKLDDGDTFSVTYTGTPHNVTATAATGVEGESVNVTVTNGTQTNAGSYESEAAGLTDGEGGQASNYKLPTNVKQSYTIQKAPVTFTVTENEVTYDTRSHTAKVTQTDSESPRLTESDFSVTYGPDKTDNKTNAGQYDVYVTLSNNNFKFDGESDDTREKMLTEKLTVNQATLTLTVSGSAITYGDLLSKSDLTGTAKIQGSETVINGTWAWDEAVASTYPTVAASGTTEYTVKFTPNEEYRGNFTEESLSTEITIIVNKAKLTPSINTVQDIDQFNGTTATTGTIKLTGAVRDENPTATGTFAFDTATAGENKSVTVTGITLSDEWTANYELSVDHLDNVGTTAKIGKRVVTLEWKLDDEGTFEITYDGEVHTVTATVKNQVSDYDCTVIVTDGEKENAGTYTAMASLSDPNNYALPTDGTQQKEYTISPAEVSFTIGAEDKVAWSTRGETNADPNPDGYESTGSGTNYALEMTYDSYTHTANVKQTDGEAVKIEAVAANGYTVTYKKEDTGDGLANVRDVGTYGIYVTINPVDGDGDVYNFKFASQDAGTHELKIGEIEIKPYEVTVIWTHLSYVYHAHTMHPDIRVQNPFKSDNNQLLPGKGLPSNFNIEHPENYDGEYLVAFAATDGSDVKEYTVTAKLYGQKAANYTVKNPTATVTIVPAPVTFTVSDNVWNLTGEHPTTVTLSPVWGVVSTTPDKDEGTDHQYPDPGTAIEAELNTKIVYKMDGEEVTPTEAGTYEVWVEIGNTNFRHSATSDGASHKVGELVLTDNPTSVKTYTVTFDAGYEGGEAPEAMENLLEGQMVILPAGLTREGYLFQGWSHSGITYRPNEEFPMPASDVTFKAEWLAMSETRKVGGTVLQEVEGGDPKPLLGATVTLKQGDNEAGEAITDANGEFSFENLTPGIYNLEIRYFNGSSTVIKTFRVDVEKNDMAGETYILPGGALNTVVDADVTAVVDMQDIVEEPDDAGIYTNADATTVKEGGTVEFKMTVKGTELDSDQIEELPVSEEQIGMVLDLKLTKTVTESSGRSEIENITDSKVPITTVIHLPAEIQGKSGYTVYRFHDPEGDGEPELQTITTSRNASGEYLQVIRGGTAIEIHATLYSTYVLTWYQSSPVVDMSGRVTVADTPHGAVTPNYPNAAPGVKVTLTVTPDEGYTVDSVTVTDRNGNVLPLTDNGDGTYSFTMPGGDVTVKAVFKLKPCDGGADCPSRKFPDLDPKSWYHEYTDYVITHSLMNGNNLGLFDPDGTVTRATVVMTLWNYENRPVVNYAMQFTDVKEGQWYTEAIRWAASEGIVGGYGDGTFQPDKPVNREELAKILYGYEQKYGSGGFKGDWMFPLAFTDSAKVSDWAYESVAWCTMNGVITGKPGNLFDPAGSAKRTDLAAMLTRYFQLAEDAE